VVEKGSEIMLSNKIVSDSTYGPIADDLARVQEGKQPRFISQPARANFSGINKAIAPNASQATSGPTTINQVDTKGMQLMANEMKSVKNEVSEMVKSINSMKYLKAVISQREIDDRDNEEELLLKYSNF